MIPLSQQVCSSENTRPIISYEGFYEITEDGIIYAKKRPGSAGNKLKEAVHKGYLRVTLSKNGKKKVRLVHRLVALTFIDNSKNLPQVNHKDGNRKNNNLSNLEWCTKEENEMHKRSVLGSDGKGEKNSNYGYSKKKIFPSENLRNKLCELGLQRSKHDIASLGEMLKGWELPCWNWGTGWQINEFKDYHRPKTEADARALLLISNIENHLYDPKNP